MRKMKNQDIHSMKAVDYAYGDASKQKKSIQKDKSKKYRQNFAHMSVKELTNMEDYEHYNYEIEYKTK
jgi:hypothetical protein